MFFILKIHKSSCTINHIPNGTPSPIYQVFKEHLIPSKLFSDVYRFGFRFTNKIGVSRQSSIRGHTENFWGHSESVYSFIQNMYIGPKVHTT